MSVRRYEDGRGVLVVLLDRPAQRNALTMEMVTAISEALRTTAPVLVIGSTDRRAFCSGADLSLSDPDRAALSDALYGLYLEMRESDTVVIAAADGHAVGGGAQLLIASDIRIAGRDASIRFAGPGHGLVVGAWGLSSLVGRGRALELCLSTRPIDADEAFRIGLIDRLADDPLEEAVQLAAGIMRLDPSVVSGVKRVAKLPDPMDALRQERAHNSNWGGAIPNGSGG